MVTKGFQEQCPDGFAQHVIFKLASTLAELNARGVVHGDISQDVVGMIHSKSFPGGYKVGKLGGFYHSTLKKEGKPVTDAHLADRDRARMAPEAEAGMNRNSRTDIWSLGQLAYQLLSQLPSDQT